MSNSDRNVNRKLDLRLGQIRWPNNGFLFEDLRVAGVVLNSLIVVFKFGAFESAVVELD